MQGVKTFGLPELASEEIDPQVAEMVNFLFNISMRDEDYKDIREDDIIKRPTICHALALVECNPQILEALRNDAKKADFSLKDVNKDIHS